MVAPEYGYGFGYEENSEYARQERASARLALRAFMLGHRCQFRGPHRSPVLARVPRQHESYARMYFRALEGKGVMHVSPWVMRHANRIRAQRLRNLAQAC